MPVLDVPVRRQITMPATELRADVGADGADMTLAGHAAVFNTRSEDLGGFVEVLAPGAFDAPLARGDDVRLLVNHSGLPLARTRSGTLTLSADQQGLAVSARVAPSERATELRTLIARGDVDQMSFAFTVAPGGDDFETVEGTVVRTVSAVDRLFDVSVVTFPAYPATDAQMRRVEINTSPARAGRPVTARWRESIGRRTTLAAAESERKDR